MKKILTMAVGLLTVIALFAVVAAARSGDGNDDSARTAAATVADEGAEADGEDAAYHRLRDADEDDHEDDEEGAHRRWRDMDDDERRGFHKGDWLPRERIPAIKAWFADQGPDWETSYDSPADLLAALVADGVITREQADALTARMEAQAERELGKLAEMGIITSEQIPAIIDWLATQDAALKQGLEDPAGLLEAMVEDDIITQEQADSITELLTEYDGMKKSKHHRGGDMLFDKLAAEGIIPQDQLPAITAWIMEQGPDLAESYENPAEMLEAMVEDNVITQEQADSITELFAEYEGMKSEAASPAAEA